MSAALDPREVEHALELLRETPPGWTGRVAVLEVDAVCRFDAGAVAGPLALQLVPAPCNRPLHNVVVLQSKDDAGGVASVLGVCSHHTEVMRAAVEIWRRTQ
jgi:hypothetical protein